MNGATEARRMELLDRLARLEHAQWREWALNIIDTEEITEARAKRWLSYMQVNDWDDLPEEVKDKDREWAEKVLFAVKRHMGIK